MKTGTWKTFQIHGTDLLLGGDPYLTARIAEYFRLLYQGGVRGREMKLKFEVHPAEAPPNLPPDAVKAIQGPHACCYGWGERVLFMSRNGTSMIRLDPVRGEVHGFLDREFSRDSPKFFSLLGMTVIETLKYLGLYFLHGACVRGNGRSYLFCGRSGAGKTTAAFNLVRQGFQFVADDSLFLSEHDGDITVSPYYTNFHVDENVVRRCPEVLGVRKIKDREDRGFARMRVNMTEIYPDSFVPSLKPERVIFPRIIPDGKSSFSAISQMAVYERLLKQTILAVDTGIVRKQLRTLEKLARQVRGFEVFTGPDMCEDPKILPALLEQM